MRSLSVALVDEVIELAAAADGESKGRSRREGELPYPEGWDRAPKAVRARLVAYLNALSADQKAALAALMWFGRERALAVAHLTALMRNAKRLPDLAEYLASKPLSGYLRSALRKLNDADCDL